MYKYFLSLIGLFIVDRLTKVYFLRNSSLPGGWGEFFSLYFNPDIAFSIPLAIFIIYPLVILIIVGLIVAWWKKFKKKHILHWPLALIIIGALSNLLDRINYNAVIDFINIPFFSVFNLSDIYITTGVIWILYFELFYKKYIKLNK
ncbi:signal peptidase II [bacterium]|jgi:signal peptidase II|nr:signal peptidase II [bacterium]MBT4649374.1 signal peptidase II [bacterium]